MLLNICVICIINKLHFKLQAKGKSSVTDGQLEKLNKMIP